MCGRNKPVVLRNDIFVIPGYGNVYVCTNKGNWSNGELRGCARSCFQCYIA